MNFPTSRFTYVTAALVMGLSLLLGACGGGSGTGSNDTTGPTGNVGVLITDAPTLLYDEIHVTITGIVLLPREDASDAEQVVLFEGEETIDILQLRDYADLFVVAEEVPIDDYEKVRLFISQVELVDNGTEPPSSVFATLPSGKIDLLPKEPLTVAEDQTLYLELDLDARNSLLITETGTGNLIFRPVVFVRVFEEDEGNGENGNGEEEENGLPVAVDEEEMETAGEDAPLLGVSGLVRLPEEDRVLVCPSTSAAETACVRLSLNEDSPVFDNTGALVGPDALAEGARLIAMGLLERDPEDGRRVLEVLSITMGTRPTVGTRGGAAGGPVDENGHFVLRNGRTVALAPETPVVDNRGQPLGAEAIMDGQGLTLMGIVGGPSNPIPATLVILRGDDDDDGNGEAFGASPTNIRGELIAVENDDTLQVDVNGEVHWIQLKEGGQLVISGQGRVSEGALADLGDFDRVRIIAQGEQGESYFEADRIVAITLGMNDQVVSDVGGPPPHAGPPNNGGPPDHAGPPEHAGPPGSGD